MRITSDGFLDLGNDGKVRTPGIYDERLEPLPEREALSFLLSHAFPGARRIVRPLSTRHRSALQRAMWAESVSKRMSLLDRVWRGITRPVNRTADGEAQLLQIVMYGNEWAYPLYLERGTVRVLPEGGLPFGQVEKGNGTPRIDVQSDE